MAGFIVAQERVGFCKELSTRWSAADRRRFGHVSTEFIRLERYSVTAVLKSGAGLPHSKELAVLYKSLHEINRLFTTPAVKLAYKSVHTKAARRISCRPRNYKETDK